MTNFRPTASEGSSPDNLGGEVLFEFVTMGPAVKVSAVHVPSNTEVVLMASATTSQYSLKANALRKLRAALERQTAR